MWEAAVLLYDVHVQLAEVDSVLHLLGQRVVLTQVGFALLYCALDQLHTLL